MPSRDVRRAEGRSTDTEPISQLFPRAAELPTGNDAVAIGVEKVEQAIGGWPLRTSPDFSMGTGTIITTRALRAAAILVARTSGTGAIGGAAIITIGTTGGIAVGAGGTVSTGAARGLGRGSGGEPDSE